MIALVAWRVRALTAGGALAAVLIGTAIFGSGGWRNAAVLLAFFLSGTVLSFVGRNTAGKKAIVQVGKTGARDGAQVLANGLVAAICALSALAGNSLWQVGFAAALAASTADTWGTEIGTLQRAVPRSILTGKKVAVGLSGGVSLLGTAAEIAGAFFLAAVAYSARVSPVFLAVAAGGFAGSIVDSLLGASVQALRYCRGCLAYCEVDPHHCGADTTLVRGVAWMTNDAVNFLSTAAAAAIAIAIAAPR